MEIGEFIDELPNFLVVGMEDMRTVGMYGDTVVIFVIVAMTGNVFVLFDDQDFVTSFG